MHTHSRSNTNICYEAHLILGQRGGTDAATSSAEGEAFREASAGMRPHYTITVKYIECVLCIECVLYLVQVGGPITVKYRMSKETCGRSKIDLLQRQKRPTTRCPDMGPGGIGTPCKIDLL